MKLLVTGGVGYIGCHVVRQLSEAGHEVIVLDNLSTGFKDALIHGETLVLGDLADTKLLNDIMLEYSFEAVLHFAASTVVPESVQNPTKYHSNNTRNTLNVIQACLSHDIKQFVFSGTAAVYGIPESGQAREDSQTAPINPYGTSKLMSEWILRDVSKAHDFRFVSLRYFNVAGADSESRIGQATPDATLLVKVCCEAAIGIRKGVHIYGTDYATVDGTGVRDYIHVEDLSAAHLDALTYLSKGGTSEVLNVGYGHGASVRQVIEIVQKVSGQSFQVQESPRRAGDPPELIAIAEKIKKVLGWQPKFDSLQKIVEDAWRWEQKLQNLRSNGKWTK